MYLYLLYVFYVTGSANYRDQFHGTLLLGLRVVFNVE